MTARLAGDVIGGRYLLGAELGSGGFGRVWRARDQTLDVDVAIKELRLPPGLPESQRAVRLARATREARNAARLRKYDGVVAIHDVVVDDGLPWIVMELIDGCSLSDHLDEHGPLTAGRAAQVATALLTAIAAAHREGVVHRDIKPANVMLADDGKVLLTDFGIAVHHDDTALTTTGMLIGSAEYTAPERLRGTDGMPEGDLFSLGVTLYQAVEGVSPFRRDTPEATLAAVLLEEAPPPRQAGPLTRLITGLLDKDPARRPTVARALALVPGEVPATKILNVRHDTKATKGWPLAGVAALLGLITLLGIPGLPDAGGTWERYEGRNGLFGEATVIVAVADVVLAGLLCAGLAWYLLASLPPFPKAAAAAAGLGFGCGAAAFAFHGTSETIREVVSMSERESSALSLASITAVVLVALALAWLWRRLSR
ncbi:MAG: serine/threonine protein kinase [Nonomuraea sp.]|nr:serine/threonine protein kinase [Nonomuraea sp.]